MINLDKTEARIRTLKVWLAVKRAKASVRLGWKYELAYQEGLLRWAGA